MGVKFPVKSFITDIHLEVTDWMRFKKASSYIQGFAWAIFSSSSFNGYFCTFNRNYNFNKRILDFPQAIGVPIVSAVLYLFCSGVRAYLMVTSL